VETTITCRGCPAARCSTSGVATGGGPNQLAETHIDLRPALGPGGLGHAIAVVEPAGAGEPAQRLISWVPVDPAGDRRPRRQRSPDRHTSQLDTGKAAAGVELQLAPYGSPGPPTTAAWRRSRSPTASAAARTT